MFARAEVNRKLSTQSARYVEVIHTEGGCLGTMEPLGHADFYPNGGKDQPGKCKTESHSLAIDFLAESINSVRGFYGKKCTDISLKDCKGPMSLMGGIKDNIHTTGIFTLITNSNNSYARGRYF